MQVTFPNQNSSKTDFTCFPRNLFNEVILVFLLHCYLHLMQLENWLSRELKKQTN